MFTLSVLLLFSTLLEMIGVGLVIPVVATMTQPDAVQASFGLNHIMLLKNITGTQLIALVVLSLLGFYLVKTLFLSMVIWKQNHYIYTVKASLSGRLFRGYLQQPWTFHLQRNSAALIARATQEVDVFINNALQPFIMLCTEGSILLGVILLLLIVEPIGSITAVGMLSVAIISFQKFSRVRLLSWGKLRQHHDVSRIKALQQGLGGAKDVKLLGREADFIEQHTIHNQSSALVNRKYRTMTDLPRLWIELFAVMGLCGLVLAMLLQNKPLAMFMPTLGLFAAATFRIMPSLNRILSGVQSIRFGLPVLHTLSEEILLLDTDLSATTRQDGTRRCFDTSLMLKSLQYQYPNAPGLALNNIQITVKPGMAIGFIGQSGAGKSTLVDIILGLLKPTRGQVLLDGVDIQTNLRGWQDQVGYVPQTIYLTDDTLRRNVAFGLAEAQIDDAAVLQAIKAAQLDGFISELPEGLETLVGERGVRLSGGQCQRIGIARALYHDPAVLVLDEATSALDMATEQAVMQAVNTLQGNKTLLIVAHRLSTVADCDWVYRMDKGRVVDEGRFEHVTKVMQMGQSGHEIYTEAE